MYPLLQEDDLVQVNPLTDDTPLPIPGTLILLNRDGVPVVHRYLGTRDGVHLESGDHSGGEAPFARVDLIGVVVARKRGGRVKKLRSAFFWRLRRRLREWVGR